MILGTLFEQTWISLPQGCTMLNINAFRLVVHEKKVFEDLSKFSLFCPLSGAPKGASPFIWTNLNPHLSSMFPINFGWNWPSGSWEDFLSISLLLSKSLSPWGGTIHDPRDFIGTNLNLLAPRMLHAKYQCIPAGGSWEEGFWRFIKIFLILPLY